MQIHIKKKYLKLIPLLLLIIIFIPTIKCGGFKQVPYDHYVNVLNTNLSLENKSSVGENLEYIQKEGEQLALKRLKLSHMCNPLLTTPKFRVYDGNTYLSENNTYVYQYNYDVIGLRIITDIGGWMAGDGLIEDGIFTISIKYKNGYLEFKQEEDRLILIGYGKMYGI